MAGHRKKGDLPTNLADMWPTFRLAEKMGGLLGRGEMYSKRCRGGHEGDPMKRPHKPLTPPPARTVWDYPRPPRLEPCDAL